MSGKKTKLWRDDTALFALARRELFTAVVGDIMDQLGAQRQFLPPQIRPLRDDMIVIGRAMTVLEADKPAAPSAEATPVCHSERSEESSRTSATRDMPRDSKWILRSAQNDKRSKPTRERKAQRAAPTRPSEPFGLMLQALDDLRRHEVYLCAGASPDYALWGELMSVRAQRCGAAGAVMAGYSRDTRAILALGFPTFSFGAYAQDQAPRGAVVDFRAPLRIGAVSVQPGDIVFGDIDGVCVVPRAMETEVFARALEKARGEKTVRQAIAGGMTARAAFKKFGIM